MSGELYLRAKNLVEIFEGEIPVIFYDSSSASYVPSGLGIDITNFVLGELSALLGKENVVPK
jgi:hypothetical protein